MGRLLYLVQQLRLLAEKLLTHVLLRSTALRWHWHKLLLTDRNSVVIIYVKLGLRLPFHTSSFLRFQSHVYHPCSTVPRFPPLSHGATFSSFSFSHFQRPLRWCIWFPVAYVLFRNESSAEQKVELTRMLRLFAKKINNDQQYRKDVRTTTLYLYTGVRLPVQVYV